MSLPPIVPIALGPFTFGVPWWQIVMRTVVIYVAFLVALRLFGKREIGQFTLSDLVLILLAANALQPAMTGTDSSLVGGLVIVAALFLANLAVSWLRIHEPRAREFLEGHPAVIARDGSWFPEVMRREGIDLDEAMMALREHGVDKVDAVELAVLEVDGTISVVPKDTSSLRRGRRRVRYRRLQQ
jgi:uncharacterized membrane protein YcaP (DUF421 family)